MRTVLFYRHFWKFRGGHLKVWDYFNHVLASPEFTPRIAFSAKSRWDETNPWRSARKYVVDSWHDVSPDVFFVAGRDWLMVDQHPAAAANIPVINLIQHVRHAGEDAQRFEFLPRRAIRVCVSDEVAQAVRETGLTRGPLVVIPNGLDLAGLPAPDRAPRDVDVLIVAVKRPALGPDLAHRLERPGRRVEVLAERLPRPEFLRRLQRGRVTVFLPNETEGFYLPALEGMALGTLVVCPDCIGNRSFCLPGQNALRPGYALGELARAAEAALAMGPEQAQQMRSNARRTAETLALPRERRAFLDVLDHVNQLWRDAGVAAPS
jgi:glycosyltransferase involved in cell wall biosynthesis